MTALFQKASSLTGDTIAEAIEIHRDLGPGLVESIDERCLMRELGLRNLTATNQRVVKIENKGLIFEEPLRFDILVEDCVLFELKAVCEPLPIHQAQLLRSMKLLDVPLGLPVNFNEIELTDGLKRMILPGTNQ